MLLKGANTVLKWELLGIKITIKIQLIQELFSMKDGIPVQVILFFNSNSLTH